MSSTPTSLSDTLPSSIPKLDPTGLNWAIFRVRFRDAVEAKGFWAHFDGSAERPVAAPPAEGKPPSPPTAEELAAMARWDKDELSAKSLLTQKIPDSTLMRIHSKPSVRERWEAIVKEYTEKGAYAQTDLRARFLETKCPEKSNVREFLDNLRVKREELASVGVEIDERDYRSTILSSLPAVLANFASSQLAAAQLFSPDKTILPDMLISLISEEYERQKTQHTRRSGGKGKDQADEAMSVGSSSKSRRSTSSKGSDWKSKVTCWNCREKGHFKDKCPKPPKDSARNDGKGKSKSESSREKSGGAANAVDSDSDGVFAVSCETEDEDESDDFYVSTAPTSAHVPSDADSMPDLQSVSASDPELDPESLPTTGEVPSLLGGYLEQK